MSPQQLSQLQQYMEKSQQTLELLDVSFKNMPTPSDQDVIDLVNPIPVGVIEDYLFPTVPMFNMKDNFAKLDL